MNVQLADVLTTVYYDQLDSAGASVTVPQVLPLRTVTVFPPELILMMIMTAFQMRLKAMVSLIQMVMALSIAWIWTVIMMASTTYMSPVQMLQYWILIMTVESILVNCGRQWFS